MAAGDRMTLQGAMMVRSCCSWFCWRVRSTRREYLSTGDASVVETSILIGIVGGLIVALVISFKPTMATYLAIPYAGLRGTGSRRFLGDSGAEVSGYRDSGRGPDVRCPGRVAGRVFHASHPGHSTLPNDRHRRHGCHRFAVSGQHGAGPVPCWRAVFEFLQPAGVHRVARDLRRRCPESRTRLRSDQSQAHARVLPATWSGTQRSACWSRWSGCTWKSCGC